VVCLHLAEYFANISGRFFALFDKRERVLSIYRYLYCFTLFLTVTCHAAYAQQVEIKVLDPSLNPLKGLVVYLETPQGMHVDKNDKVVAVTQIDKSFSPYIGVMQKDSAVTFHNKDNITHHIYSPLGNNKFAFKLRAGQQQLKRDFGDVGAIAMGCNIHDWMSGHLLIVDTPYYAMTDVNGVASFDVLNTGNYKIVVWHPQMATKENRMSQMLEVNKPATVKFILSKALAELPTQKNEDDFDFLSDY